MGLTLHLLKFPYQGLHRLSRTKTQIHAFDLVSYCWTTRLTSFVAVPSRLRNWDVRTSASH